MYITLNNTLFTVQFYCSSLLLFSVNKMFVRFIHVHAFPQLH